MNIECIASIVGYIAGGISLIREIEEINKNKEPILITNTKKDNGVFYIDVKNQGTIPIKNIHLHLDDEQYIKLIKTQIDIEYLGREEQREIQIGIGCRPLSAISPTSFVFCIEYTYKKWLKERTKKYYRKIEF